MFEQIQKQAVIVYRKKEDEYAHLMTNLISAFTEYEVAEWEEKDWHANKASTSSSQKVIFLGDSKEAHKRHHGMFWKYNKLRMKYGWLGNQCIVDVDPLAANELQDFRDYYLMKVTEYETITENPSLRLSGEVLPDVLPEVNEDVSEIIPNPDKKPFAQLQGFASKTFSEQKSNLAKLRSDVMAPINNKIVAGRLIRLQYNILIRDFIFHGGLKEFMEG